MDRRVGIEQLKDSVSPRFTTPVEGCTDKTGGEEEGMERVGSASGEEQKSRGKCNNQQTGNNLDLPQLLAKPPSVTLEASAHCV